MNVSKFGCARVCGQRVGYIAPSIDDLVFDVLQKKATKNGKSGIIPKEVSPGVSLVPKYRAGSRRSVKQEEEPERK